jgi:uncharacterized Zn finger protein (UPF0148 family)
MSIQKGQLLLKGWTMLQDSCPVCGTPLMRHPINREERFCATCNATVIDQSQKPAQQESKQQSSTSTAAVVAPTTAASAVAAAPSSARLIQSNSNSLYDTLAGKLSILHDAIRDVDPVREVARFNELCVSIQRCGNAMNAVSGQQ